MSSDWLRFSANNDNVAYIESTSGAYVELSDRSLKENIRPVQEGVLEKVNQINVVNYNYKRDPSGRMTTGVIAQELKPLFPQFVHGESEGSKLGVNYSGLSVIAIQAIQEQQEIIEDLENKLDQQQQKAADREDRLQSLEQKVEQLEAMLMSRE